MRSKNSHLSDAEIGRILAKNINQIILNLENGSNSQEATPNEKDRVHHIARELYDKGLEANPDTIRKIIKKPA